MLLFIGLGCVCVGGRGRKDKSYFSWTLHMPTFEIPTGPPIAERGTTYLISEAKLHHVKWSTAPYGSITYDHEKGTMPLEWKNEHDFLVWLATKEHENSICCNVISMYVSYL
jgi:hypothetical protein